MGPTSIFSSVSARDPALEARLRELFADGPTAGFGVSSLRRDAHAEDESCWLHGDGICLSTCPLDPRPPLQDYAGTFQAEGGGEVVFSVRRGALHAASTAGNSALLASSADCFQVPGVTRMRFERDADGRVGAVEIMFGGQQLRARRVV